MNNKIENPAVEVPSGIALNDKDYLNSCLSCLKEMSKNMTVALTEASNEHIYTVYKKMFDEIISLQRQVFEFMFRYGWYKLEKAEKNKIDTKYNMLNSEFNSLNISKSQS